MGNGKLLSMYKYAQLGSEIKSVSRAGISAC